VIRTALVLAALLLPTHVEPQVSEAPAGSRATFGFLVEHGCGGSPTVQVSIQLPDGAFDAVPQAPEGWTGVVEPGAPPVVTFTGGPLPADVPATFAVELVTPNRPGETVLFPTVQTCEAGEIGWVDPAEESEEPAPRIVLTANPDPILPSATAAPTTTTVVEEHDPTEGPTTTSVVGEPDGASEEDDDGFPVVPVVAAVAVLAAAAAVSLRSRRSP
jgi:uncharacterized protein YcnI